MLQIDHFPAFPKLAKLATRARVSSIFLKTPRHNWKPGATSERVSVLIWVSGPSRPFKVLSNNEINRNRWLPGRKENIFQNLKKARMPWKKVSGDVKRA